MALPNKPMGELKAIRDPEVEEREVDVLIVGGGMAACRKIHLSSDKIIAVAPQTTLLFKSK